MAFCFCVGPKNLSILRKNLCFFFIFILKTFRNLLYTLKYQLIQFITRNQKIRVENQNIFTAQKGDDTKIKNTHHCKIDIRSGSESKISSFVFAKTFIMLTLTG